MQIIVPGTPEEFRSLYLETYANGCPTYLRLTRDVNRETRDVKFGKAEVVKVGSRMTIIAVGSMLQLVLDAVNDLDVTVLYYTTLAPFDAATLCQNLAGNHILVCEPYYMGALDYDIMNSVEQPIKIHHVGIPHEFCKHYGGTKENYIEMGVSVENIRKMVESLV